jgi:DNA modification methylase
MAEPDWHLSELHERTENGELFGRSGTVHLFHGPAQTFDSALAEIGRSPDLIYIDPPFATNRAFKLRLDAPNADTDERVERVAYRDQWEDGLDGYLRFMRSVVESFHDHLADQGSLLLHCDQRAAPYLSVQCDEIFGRGVRVDRNAAGFRAELVWHYGLGGSSKRSYPRKHDNILWYSRGDEWTFTPPKVPARSQRMAGKMKKMPDVFDLPSLNNMAKERCGYPTQKPLELLDMLIEAHSNPQDLVVDTFGGSGTTAVSAARHGRDALVMDQSDDAVAMMRDRILKEVPNAKLRIYRRVEPDWSLKESGAESGDADVWRMYPGTIDENGVFRGLSSGDVMLVRTLDGHEHIMEVSR